MTDKQKLQSLFAAALKAPAEPAAAPPQPIPAPAPPAAVASQAQAESPAQPATPAPQAPVLDPAAAAELGRLLDDQHLRKKRKRRLELLVTCAVLFGSTAGGTLWFVQDPARVVAFREAMRDIRSFGDVKSLVAKYQDALDRISARGRQIDQATAAMGVKPSSADEKDPFLDAEMKQMMGEGGGKTVGERNRLLGENFDHMAKETGGVPKATRKTQTGEVSFDWTR